MSLLGGLLGGADAHLRDGFGLGARGVAVCPVIGVEAIHDDAAKRCCPAFGADRVHEPLGRDAQLCRDFRPRDVAAPNQDALGGQYFAALRLESEFPVGLPEEYGLHGGVFFDVGSVWGLEDTAGVTNPVDDGMNLRSAIGVSVFWDSALGPLRLNFMKAIKKEDYDEEQNFDLTIATKF